LFVKDGIPYYRCRSCQVSFAKPPHNPNLTNNIEDFEEAYLRYFGPDAADDANFTALTAWMGRFGSLSGRSLLDVGCGSGKLVRYLRQQGVQAWGLEPSTALYRHFLADETFFVNGAVDSFAPTQTFDIVTAFDVVEHVEEPMAFLEGIGALLSANGLLFLSTPDEDSGAARLLGRHWHFYCPYHLSYFSRRTLPQAAATLGFQLVDFSRRGRWRSLGYMCQYLCEFLLRVRPPGWLRHLHQVHVPINLFDTMYLCFRKQGQQASAAAPESRVRVTAEIAAGSWASKRQPGPPSARVHSR
jgi:SAM-dependent methyltransferase